MLPFLALAPATLWQQVLTDFAHLGDAATLATFVQVLLIDVALAGDNAVVVGSLAAGLPARQRRIVILIGIAAALVLRVAFALIATWLLGIVGLILAGGLLLLWVAWRMARELRQGSAGETTTRPARSFIGAAVAVAVADLSMSLDNVLAVAGAARDHPGVLVVGLIVSVALMGIAANFIARVIDRYRWIGWLGLAVIVFVAVRMIWQGVADPAVGILTLV